ncbi:MAG: type II toxin-antitoxin system prevent-host-death family antitoxin, partial [Syntrophomonadaceae bacterium]|nr:type II toxin-antitoxin system prevent-host-death family antitoxin [Syntrophomonadaceae bacterium]
MNNYWSTTLRNDYNAVSRLAREKAEPVYITKNGEGDLVIMSIEAFERREALLDLKEKLLLAEEQRIAGAPA